MASLGFAILLIGSNASNGTAIVQNSPICKTSFTIVVNPSSFVYAFLKIFQKTVETTGNNFLIDILLNKYGPYRDGGI